MTANPLPLHFKHFLDANSSPFPGQPLSNIRRPSIARALTEEAEAKRWLIDRVDGMVEGLRLQVEDEYDAFAGLVESVSDSIMGLRNNALTLIAFLFTLAIALATLKIIDLLSVEYALIILAFIGIAAFFILNSLHSYFMDRLEHVENAYLGGINILHYLWGSYYSGGTMNVETVTTETIHVLDDYAKVVAGAIYSNILVAYEGAIGSTLRGNDRDEFRRNIKHVSGYTERAYQKYKAMRETFRAPGFLSNDLLAMVQPFEDKFDKEAERMSS